MEVRQLEKSVRDEGEGYPRDCGDAVRARHRARQAERAVTGKREARQRRDAVDGQRAQADGEEREEEQRDAIIILAKGERVLIRKKDIGVEKVKRIMKGLMKVPPERPGQYVGVAFVEHSVAYVQYPGPGHDERETDESEDDKQLTRQRTVEPGQWN